MKLDSFGVPVFNEQDIFECIYQDQNLNDLIVQDSQEIKQLEEISNLNLTKYQSSTLTIEEFDLQNQSNWFMPVEYKQLDIVEWIVNQCDSDCELNRVHAELVEFNARGLLDLLRWLKYFVDTCRENHILWGVGRGSSTASYVLYKIGVHKIDCLKYDLDWQDFLRK